VESDVEAAAGETEVVEPVAEEAEEPVVAAAAVAELDGDAPVDEAQGQVSAEVPAAESAASAEAASEAEPVVETTAEEIAAAPEVAPETQAEETVVTTEAAPENPAEEAVAAAEPAVEVPTGEASTEDGASDENSASQPAAEAPAAETPAEETPAEPAVEAPAAEPAAEPVAEVSAADEKAAAKLAARQKKIAEADPDSPFSILVGEVYDGPLDLLLDLIRKQDIDIYDIPIARITSQFLAYVDRLKSTDVDVAGEFIYTASLLIHIKSKMLLPRAPVGEDDQAEDPRRELVERLLEHERFKNAAQMLLEKQMLEAASWTNPGLREFKHDEGTEPEIAADTVDLVRVFREILERARTRPVINVDEESVTVGQMMQFLTRRLTMEDKPVALKKLLRHSHSERALIAMFLALLELVRLQAILLRQDRAFSDILIKKNTGFDAFVESGTLEVKDEWR
jgi:segregation and condensation protein A